MTARPTRSKPAAARARSFAVMLVLACLTFVATGCYDDPYYYGRRSMHSGVYASYGAPAPYYYGDGYPYGYATGYGRYSSPYYASRGVYVSSSRYRDYDHRRPRRSYRRWNDGRRWDDGRRREYRRRSEARPRREQRSDRSRAGAPQRQAPQDDAERVERQEE